jgi:ArsR family transcriptional regulator
MDRDVKARYEAKARVLKAMAHPTRLFVVDQLAKGERCVCELTEMVGDDVSTVSKHLSVLKGAGIVVDEKRGNQVFYSLRVPCVLNFFSCVESVLKTSAQEPSAPVA